MNRLLRIAASIIIACAPIYASASSKAMETEIFDPLFRTLTLTLNDNLMADPVITIGSSDNLVISFDEIADDRSYLRCRLIHCNADWRPSSLHESEFVDGFNFAEIEDFGYSSNTFIRYVNYRFEIGKNGLRPLVSGNYIWQVFEENDPDKVLLQARFRVAENNLTILGEASSRTDRGLNDQWQQLNVSIDNRREIIPNPFTDVILEVLQNGRPDTSRFINHPQRLEGERIIYEHLPELIFPAGNEYRRFETVRNDYPGMGVDSTGYIEPLYHAWLSIDSPRADHGYIYDSTQRGRFKIDEYNSTDPDLGADYIMTHFTLDFPEVMDGDIYLEGELALRGYSDLNKMSYDRQSGLYSLAIPLKQGSYNYQYVIKAKNPNKVVAADASLIEGNKFETVNEYNVYLWLRMPGSRADRLLASKTFITN